MPAKKRRNPFYVLLVPVGIAFVVTAFAYGLMAFQAVNSAPADDAAATAAQSHTLFRWLRANGDRCMLIELGVLGVLTVAAIATDRFWDAAPRPKPTNP